jgi:hypothetical protein
MPQHKEKQFRCTRFLQVLRAFSLSLSGYPHSQQQCTLNVNQSKVLLYAYASSNNLEWKSFKHKLSFPAVESSLNYKQGENVVGAKP